MCFGDAGVLTENLFGFLREQVLFQQDAHLLAHGLQLIEVLLVLALVLHLGLDAFEDAHRGREVVDPSGGLEGGDEDCG